MGIVFGVEYLRDEYQRSQEYSGTIVKRYSAPQFLNKKNSRFYWDIRSADGEIHSPWIRPRDYWESAREGSYVIKKSGELYPTLAGR